MCNKNYDHALRISSRNGYIHSGYDYSVRLASEVILML